MASGFREPVWGRSPIDGTPDEGTHEDEDDQAGRGAHGRHPMKESTPCTAASTSKGIITVAQMRRNHPRPN